MSWAFSIGDFLVAAAAADADPTTEVQYSNPARARPPTGEPQNGPRLSEQHLPPINKGRKEGEERANRIGKGDGSARCLIIDGIICLKRERQRDSQQEAAWDWISIVMTSAESRPSESRLIGRSLAG